MSLLGLQEHGWFRQLHHQSFPLQHGLMIHESCNPLHNLQAAAYGVSTPLAIVYGLHIVRKGPPVSWKLHELCETYTFLRNFMNLSLSLLGMVQPRRISYRTSAREVWITMQGYPSILNYPNPVGSSGHANKMKRPSQSHSWNICSRHFVSVRLC